VRGLGGRSGPDLGEIPARHSFNELAATMWNHIPRMAEQMRTRRVPASRILPREAGDLFAYLYTLDYFDPPGNPGDGRALFFDKQCVLCHQVGGIGGVVGPSLDFLGGYRSPIPVAAAMWNHGPAMAEQMRAREVTRPSFTGRELEDLIAFLRSTMGVPPDESTHVLPGRAEAGRELFSGKACATCHGPQGRGGVGPALAGRGSPEGMIDFAARMWNKAPAMIREMSARGVSVPELSAAEMADIVAYLYAMGYFAGSGDADRGSRVVVEKGCTRCHVAGQAPELGGGLYVSGTQVFAAMWNHALISDVEDRDWPSLTATDVAHLVSYFTAPR
jgi:mono/diheme cytochrome c family protein